MNDAKMNPVEAMPDPSRRKFLNTAALAGLAGAGMSVGLSACNKKPLPGRGPATAPAAAPAAAHAASDLKLHMAPGELGTYYGVGPAATPVNAACSACPRAARSSASRPSTSTACQRLGHHQRVEEGHRHPPGRSAQVQDRRHPPHPRLRTPTAPDGKYFWVND